MFNKTGIVNKTPHLTKMFLFLSINENKKITFSSEINQQKKKR